MDTVLRAAVVYLLLLALVALAGKRTLGEMTTFDFVLLLVIAEATQQGLLGQDYSVTGAALVILTLVGIDIALSLVKARYPRMNRLAEGRPVVIVEDGKMLEERVRKERVDEEDILEAARRLQGLERLDQIKYAVLERHGGISIIPRSR